MNKKQYNSLLLFVFFYFFTNVPFFPKLLVAELSSFAERKTMVRYIFRMSTVTKEFENSKHVLCGVFLYFCLACTSAEPVQITMSDAPAFRPICRRAIVCQDTHTVLQAFSSVEAQPKVTSR